MNAHMRALVGIVALAAWAGCKPAEGPSQPASTQQQGAGVIETMTQKSKVEAGKRTAAKVREIGEEQRRDLEQVMGE